MKRQPEKRLRHLPKNLGYRIDRAILSLADDPRPSGSKKLIGHHNLYRMRVGSWRIIYAVEDDHFIVLVIRIAPRGDAYHNI